MKHHRILQNQKSAQALPPDEKADSPQGTKEFRLRADDIATRAYFSYVSQGSQPGHDSVHWLEAEAQLLAEHNLAQSHGSHAGT